MSETPLYKSPGLDANKLWEIINTPRAKIANYIYATILQGDTSHFVNCTAIGDRAGRLVGFAFTPEQLEKLLKRPEVRGAEIARQFFNQFSREGDSTGRYILVGTDLDVFLDLLAGVQKPQTGGLIVGT